MKKILIITLLCIAYNSQAQDAEQFRMAYFLSHRDSISSLYIRLIFQVKNEDGETLEAFAKRKLGKRYEEHFMMTDKNQLDMVKIESLIKSPKFIVLLFKVKRAFFKEEKFRKSFIRNWNNTHTIINELVCTKKEYDKMVETTLISHKLYFTFLLFPLLAHSLS